MNNLWILAQTAGEEALSGIASEPVTSKGAETTTVVASDPNAASTGTRAPGLFSSPMLLLGLMFVLMYFILFRGPRKKQQKHKQMVQSLQKNDRIRTIGGIIGTVVDIKDDEITLKVDESTNTKIKIASSAIGKNLSQEKN
jgi:preprotein translocase subunit YajC